MTGTRNAGRTIREAIGRELLEARKARDTLRVRAQRALLSAIDNAEAVPAPQQVDYSNPALGDADVDRARLGEEEVREAFRREHAERVEAAAELREHGQEEAAVELDAEADVIASYLARVPELLAPTTAS